MNKYKITASLCNPFDNVHTWGVDDEWEEDYIFISDESNPFEERKKRIKKYPIDGAVEEWGTDMGESFIDEDADGVYLLEKVK